MAGGPKGAALTALPEKTYLSAPEIAGREGQGEPHIRLFLKKGRDFQS